MIILYLGMRILSVNEGLPPALLIQSNSGDNKGSTYFMDQSLNR
jgi:hypothetical protein